MDPLLNDDQQAYRQSLRKFLTVQWTDDHVRSVVGGERDVERAIWGRLAAELGVAGLNIPEVHGGSGGAPAEALLVAEELGRALYGGPYVGTVVMAANAVLLSGDDEMAERLLPGIAAGEATAALALVDEGRDRDRSPVPEARLGDDGWVLDGTARRVIGGSSADHLLVEASSPSGRSIFLLDDEVGVQRVPDETLDPTRDMATVFLTGATATLVGREAGAPEICEALRPLIALALAAEAVGGAARCVTDTVEYAKVREQFGRPIGSFQAVKHRCAEMQVRLEGATAAVRHAGRVLVDGSEDVQVLATVVKVFATRAYFRTAADMIQLHGGIGFTWEHTAHVHFKRAKSLELIGGSHVENKAAIADVVLAR